VPGRTLAIGDIHGCDVALEILLATLAIRSDDTVVVLGDAVDRGPASRQVVERLLQLTRECRLVFILGNHEEMLLEALDGNGSVDAWLRYGGLETLMSYGGDLRKITLAHREFLESGLDYWETAAELFIHANLEPGVPLENQPTEWLRWTHLSGFELPHPSGKRIICGHTPQKSGSPLAFDGWACIDTYACGTGWLTCLDVGTNQWFQSNQDGQSRSGWLSSPALPR
jgi:serine/threonine protein phosphatase 1